MNLLDLYVQVAELHEYLDKILSQDDVNFDIQFKNHKYNFESVFLIEDKEQQTIKRKELLRALLHDHVSDIVDHVTLNSESHWTPRNLIVEVLLHHGHKPESATLEIVSEEYDVTERQKPAIKEFKEDDLVIREPNQGMFHDYKIRDVGDPIEIK
jgi:hypothetical protein